VASPNRVRLSREERRREIVAAAREVFLVSGLQGARTREIARVAGVNEALIYQHFSSKDELFEVAVVSPLRDVVARVSAEARGLPPGTEALQRQITCDFVRSLLAALAESVSLLGVVLFADGEAGRAFYRSRVTAMLDTVADVVRSNLASWSHRDFDPDVVTRAIFGMCWGLAMDATFRGCELPLDTVAEAITGLVYEGLGIPGPGSPVE